MNPHDSDLVFAAILGLADELAAGTERFARAAIKELASTIAAQSHDMAYLIEDLLVAARVDIGEVDVDPASVDLRQEFDDVAAILGASADTRCRLDGEVRVWADPARVRQILRNLLTNAQRYGGPHVIATIGSGPVHAELTVRDDGEGVAEDRRDRIFEPYERGHSRSGMTQSIGIGLAVSKQLAQLMRGDLTYRFDDGWSVLTLALPVVQPQSGSEGQRSD